MNRQIERLASRALGIVLLLAGVSEQLQADTRALLVGVSATEDKRISDLGFAAEDTQQIREVLQDGGISAENIVQVWDDAKDGALKPTLKNIRFQLGTLSRLQPEDTLILFFSGHGVLLDGKFYLVPFDAQGDELQATCLAFAEIQRALTSCPAKRRLVLLDCCRSEPGKLVSGVSETDTIVDPAKLLANAEGTVVISSCQLGQRSYEYTSRGQGLFTAGLVESLSGQAAQIRDDGWVDTSELADDVVQRVSLLAERIQKIQQPAVTMTELTGPFPVVRVNGMATEASVDQTSAVAAGTGTGQDSGRSVVARYADRVLFWGVVMAAIWFVWPRRKVVRVSGTRTNPHRTE